MREENRTITSHTRTSIRRRGVRLTKEQREVAQEKFLKSFRNTANMRASCMAAGIDRNTVYGWLEVDEVFSLEYKQAELDANDLIRGELFRRAVQGYEKPVVSVGKIVYGSDEKPLMEKVYSDNLLALLAKARMPEFRDKQSIDVQANVTGSVQSDLSNELRLLSSEQLAQFKQWLQEAKAKQEQ
jgi:hypothetical protein